MHASTTRPLLAAGLLLALLAALAALAAASAAASASSAAAYASASTNATSTSASASTFTSMNSAAARPARTLMQRGGGRGGVVPRRDYHELGLKGTEGAVGPRRPRPRTRRPPPEAAAAAALQAFDCAQKHLAMEFAARLQPWRAPSVFADIADALNGGASHQFLRKLNSRLRCIMLGSLEWLQGQSGSG